MAMTQHILSLFFQRCVTGGEGKGEELDEGDHENEHLPSLGTFLQLAGTLYPLTLSSSS